MRQLQRAGSRVKYGVFLAVITLLAQLNNNTEETEGMRWVDCGYNFEHGYITIMDTEDNSKHSVQVWTDGKDFYAVPWFALDAGDNGWSGISANGQDFETVNEQPVLVSY